MEITHISKQTLLTSKWSGGTTTQLFIYPPEASYAERNFLCRISTATVEIPESDFTPLPGVERILMILDGELTITHKDQYTKKLKPFDTDIFSGDWKTKGRGLVTDFNVMTKGETIVTLNALALAQNDTEILELRNSILVIYVYKGEASINSQVINAGDVLILNAENKNETISLQSTGATLIITTIRV